MVCAPVAVTEGRAEFRKGQRVVYHPHVFLRTWLAMKDQGSVAVPEDVSVLIEAVYDDR